ncbi:MAG: acyloxyacyl hydrolase [Thermoanaerobaculia bacterium]
MPRVRYEPAYVIRPVFVLGLAALLMLAWQGPATAQDTSWTAYAGRWGVGKDGETSELGFEARRAMGDRRLDLVGGLAGTADEAIWLYAGASRGFEPGSAWEVRPGFAISVFEEGDGKDLGGTIEFRSSLEVAYRVRPELRFGLLVYHLSNAGIYDMNPGANSVVLTFGFH